MKAPRRQQRDHQVHHHAGREAETTTRPAPEMDAALVEAAWMRIALVFRSRSTGRFRLS